MEQRLLDERWREIQSPFPIALLFRRVLIAADTFDEICDLNLGMQKCYHPPSVPRPYIDFQFSQIFSISLSCPCCSPYSSILSIFDATLKTPSSSTKLRDTWLLFSVKINSRDSRLMLLPIFLAYFRIIKSFSQSTTYFPDTTCYSDISRKHLNILQSYGFFNIQVLLRILLQWKIVAIIVPILSNRFYQNYMKKEREPSIRNYLPR